LLGERLVAEKSPWRVVNASVSGETTSGGVRRLPALIADHHPRLVVIELGANDGLRGQSLQSMRSNLQTMVNTSRQHGAQVMLIGIRVPPNYGRDYTERFAQVFIDLGRDNKLPILPFLFEGIATQMELFQADRLHPTEEAQPLLLANVWRVLSPAISVGTKRIK
jgi:acyl-CoA thioesterase-1